MLADRAGFPTRREESHNGDKEEEEEKNRECDPIDLIGHDDAFQEYLSSRSLADLWGFVGGAAPINEPDQQRADRHPCQLVPIEKWKPEQLRLQEVVERHPQQADKRQQQQNPHWANSTGRQPDF